VTDGQTDRQTDGQTEFSSLYSVCITCSAVKINPPNKNLAACPVTWIFYPRKSPRHSLQIFLLWQSTCSPRYPDLSTVLSQFTRVTDGRTDGQTDRRTDRILIARPRLHSMQRGKNNHSTALLSMDCCSIGNNDGALCRQLSRRRPTRCHNAFVPGLAVLQFCIRITMS